MSNKHVFGLTKKAFMNRVINESVGRGDLVNVLNGAERWFDGHDDDCKGKEASGDEQSQVIPLLRQEEGVCYTPYYDPLGNPTTGVGFKLAEAGEPLPDFSIGDKTIDAWLGELVDDTLDGMSADPDIHSAMLNCNQPRLDILTSMAYQMGVSGLEEFKCMLQAIYIQDFNAAADEMLDSTWAKQTPERANRHADVMRSGVWQPTYNF